jgi:hypothetical protein
LRLITISAESAPETARVRVAPPVTGPEEGEMAMRAAGGRKAKRGEEEEKSTPLLEMEIDMFWRVREGGRAQMTEEAERWRARTEADSPNRQLRVGMSRKLEPETVTERECPAAAWDGRSADTVTGRSYSKKTLLEAKSAPPTGLTSNASGPREVLLGLEHTALLLLITRPSDVPLPMRHTSCAPDWLVKSVPINVIGVPPSIGPRLGTIDSTRDVSTNTNSPAVEICTLESSTMRSTLPASSL